MPLLVGLTNLVSWQRAWVCWVRQLQDTTRKRLIELVVGNSQLELELWLRGEDAVAMLLLATGETENRR